MRVENDNSSNRIIMDQAGANTKKEEIVSKSLTLNATSTPAITLNDKIVNSNTGTNSPAIGGYSPSLMPVSIQWLSQNPNLLGKFLEYYKVVNISKKNILSIFIKRLLYFYNDLYFY